jgi:hypothetical protein
MDASDPGGQPAAASPPDHHSPLSNSIGMAASGLAEELIERNYVILSSFKVSMEL